MEINDYLKTLIEDQREYSLSEEDNKIIKHEGIESLIYKKLNSSKYRASAIEETYKQKVKDKIHLAITHEKPLYITLPFGATKNPYLPTAPGIDWAEVFNMAFVREYLRPIAAAYKNGVILDYVSVAVFEEKVNRIPRTDTNQYENQFRELLSHFSKYLPKGLTYKFSRVEDTISREDIEKQLDIKMNEFRKTWEEQTDGIKAYKLLRAKRNSLWSQDDKDLDKKILNSALGHDSFCSECWTTEAAPWDKKIMITLGHTYTIGWAIHIRSARGSTVNFWSGIGTLVKSTSGLTPTVLSPSQYKDLTDRIKKNEIENPITTLPQLRYIPVVE